MQFITVKDAITTTLGAAAADRFRTIGYQSQSTGATEIKGNNRSVRVYYSSGDFPKNAGSINGPTQHDITFSIELAVAEPAKADLTVLDDENASAAAKATALLNAREADQEADASFDELADIVYQILMDSRNQEYGLTNQVANRWVSGMQKDQIGRQGALVTITGVIRLGLRVSEDVVGATGDTLIDIDTAIKVENQPAIAGVIVPPT